MNKPANISPAQPTQEEVDDFVRAAGRGDVKAVERFLKLYPTSVNVRASEGASMIEGYSALMNAANLADRHMVKLLLERGANVNLQDCDGTTAVMIAAEKHYESILRLLLERDVSIDAQNGEGYTALMLAIDSYSDEETIKPVAQMLLEKDADLAIKNNIGWTALRCAKEWCSELAPFLERRAEVSAEKKEKKYLAEDIADFSPKLKRSMQAPKKLGPKP